MTEREQIELELAAQAFARADWRDATDLKPYFLILKAWGIRDPLQERLMLPGSTE